MTLTRALPTITPSAPQPRDLGRLVRGRDAEPDGNGFVRHLFDLSQRIPDRALHARPGARNAGQGNIIDESLRQLA